MREIKFRARHTEDGVWIYGSSVSKDTSNINTVPLSMFWAGIEAGTLDAKTVGQYTGLKDTNDKDLYEGDIFRNGWFTEYDLIFQIVFCQLDTNFPFAFVLVADENRNDETSCMEFDSNKEWWEPEVIGNIYENPDLLLKEVVND